VLIHKPQKTDYHLPSDKILVSASVEFNGGLTVVDSIKSMQDVSNFDDFVKSLQKIVEKHPRGETYSNLALGEIELPKSLELVFDCEIGTGAAPVENITSDYIFVINCSEIGVRVHQYLGDYVDVEPNEMLVFDSRHDAIVVKMR